MFDACICCAASNRRRRTSPLQRWLCGLGLWLVDRFCAPAPPLSAARETGPRLSARASRRILRRISDKLRETGAVESKHLSK
jgi:hypothetical protein